MSSSETFSQTCREVSERRTWELLPSGFHIELEAGRHQIVALEIFDHEDFALVRLITTIGPAPELTVERLELALQANADLPYGALAIRGDDLCMVDTLILEDADANELEAKVEFLARHADRYEKILFGTDDH